MSLAVAYAAIGALLSLPMIPVLYFKMVVNSFLAWKRRRSQFLNEQFLVFISALLLGPFIIVIALLIDLCKLGDALMKEEHQLELKY